MNAIVTGSQKQVEWATSIREMYRKVAAQLAEAEEILRDVSQSELVEFDPIRGEKSVRKVYTHNLDGVHYAAIRTATPWRVEIYNSPELAGHIHQDRMEYAESVAAQRARLEKAIEMQTDARYWIDRR